MDGKEPARVRRPRGSGRGPESDRRMGQGRNSDPIPPTCPNRIVEGMNTARTPEATNAPAVRPTCATSTTGTRTPSNRARSTVGTPIPAVKRARATPTHDRHTPGERPATLPAANGHRTHEARRIVTCGRPRRKTSPRPPPRMADSIRNGFEHAGRHGDTIPRVAANISRPARHVDRERTRRSHARRAGTCRAHNPPRLSETGTRPNPPGAYGRLTCGGMSSRFSGVSQSTP